MKNSLKIAIMATAALTATAAFADTEDAVLTGASKPTQSIEVISTATLSGSTWTYEYQVEDNAGSTGTPLYIDSFTVQDVLDQAGLAVTVSPTDWSGSPSAAGQNVNWTTTSSSTSVGTLPLTFEFTSPFAPEAGGASANDNTSYAQTSGEVLVPTVPDGGMTAILLGGSLLGLGAVRRKFGYNL